MKESIESKVLGKKVSALNVYHPSVLVAVPRIENRVQYNIDENCLPFVGRDVWNAYEVSFLTNKGLPITLVAKIVYNCCNKYIVESKSLKLYLNSFNMMKYGNTIEEAKEIVKRIIEIDLTKLLDTNVVVSFHEKSGGTKIYKDFIDIKDLIDLNDIEFNNFNESPNLLKFNEIEESRFINIRTNILRSNCKVTHQPDWGTAFIYIKSKNMIDLKSLIQYIVSFRNENHFHEEVCEMIYKRLYDILKPEELMVTCIYTRRGGIDICPSRATHLHLIDSNLIDPNISVEKLLNQ